MFITNWCIRERLSVWMIIKYNKVTNWRMQTNFQSLKLGLDTVWGPFVRSLDFRWVWKNLHSVDCHNHTSQKYYENAMNNTSTSQAPCSNNANSVKSSTRVCWLVDWLTARVSSPPLVYRNVDLKDSSGFISNTVKRSHLNLMTRRPVKHDTGSHYSATDLHVLHDY